MNLKTIVTKQTDTISSKDANCIKGILVFSKEDNNFKGIVIFEDERFCIINPLGDPISTKFKSKEELIDKLPHYIFKQID